MKKNILLLIALFVFPYITFSQEYKNSKLPVEKRVKSLLSKMILEEKIDYLGGVNSMYIRAIPRLGLPEIKMSDGPTGVRTYGQATAYPAGVLAAATWNVELEKEVGQAMGTDCRAKGVNILLAPGVNICRAPMCGRNFEYFGEDPYLSGRMAVAFIKGVQSKRVVACVKHFAGNDQEWERVKVSSDIDERTLQEIYLPAFKAAVMDGKVGSVMDSYNLLNGEHTTQNSHLNNEILKGQWGFDGVLMSDWGAATWDGVAAAKGGLDLEMPSGDHMNREILIPAIKNGTISESLINDKVSRILRMILRFGFYDKPQEDKSIPLDNPANAKVALNEAREGIVLLKNEDRLLPLAQDKLKSIAVIGPNAAQYAFGRGSSETAPFHSVTPFEGIKNLVGDKVQVNFASGTANVSNMINALFYTQPGSEERGLKGEYFNNVSLSGDPVATRVDQKVDFNWGDGAPDLKGVSFPVDNFSIRWTGVIRPENAGIYTFVAKGDDGYRLWVDNKLVIDDWKDQGSTMTTATIALKKGKEYAVKLEYYENAGSAEIHFGWGDDNKNIKEAEQCAASSDVAIVCVGFNGEEGEGSDRSFALPSGQNELINAVAKVNPNTIVVVNAGGNVDMQQWLPNVKGLLHGWYSGQEGGIALAEILFGKVNPSGKLPQTFEKRWEDNPTHDNYYAPEGTLKVKYREGLLVGYRYYDTKHVEPQFPFGYGLSYTTFAYSDLKVVPHAVNGKPGYVASFDIKNTGKRAGAESAQVYVKALHPSVEMPEKELKGFTKVSLQAGEKKRVSVVLNSDAFSYYNTDLKRFVVDKGAYQIIVGASSRDSKLKENISVK